MFARSSLRRGDVPVGVHRGGGFIRKRPSRQADAGLPNLVRDREGKPSEGRLSMIDDGDLETDWLPAEKRRLSYHSIDVLPASVRHAIEGVT